MITMQHWVWELFCMALFYCSFCRAVHITPAAHLDIKVANFLMGIVTMLGMVAPLYGWRPDPIVFLFVFSMLLMQSVTSRSWRNGIPADFETVPRLFNRRQSDKSCS